NIAIMAYAFADYALKLSPTWKEHMLWLTIGPVVALSALNGLGVVAGKVTQNILTTTKVIGLAAIVLAALYVSATSQPQPRAAAAVMPKHAADYGLALVFVLYAFGGWAHAAYVAAEVRDQHRNLPRALMFGITGITLIYLIVNVSYLLALGFD